MFQSDSNPHELRSGAPAEIAQWKAAVQDFFTGEWTNLRGLIRRLEENDWEDVELTAPASPPREVPRAAAAAIEAPPSSKGDRLAELARSLQSRLKKGAENV